MGGVLINQAIHTLDLLNFLLGDIKSIKGNVDTRVLQDVIEVEDTADATIIFKSGARALFYATNCYVQNSIIEIEIVCEKAVLRLSDGLHISYENGDMEEVVDLDKATGVKAYWGLGHGSIINDFYDSIMNNREFAVNGKEGIKTIKLIEALYNSSKTRKIIEL